MCKTFLHIGINKTSSEIKIVCLKVYVYNFMCTYEHYQHKLTPNSWTWVQLHFINPSTPKQSIPNIALNNLARFRCFVKKSITHYGRSDGIKAL